MCLIEEDIKSIKDDMTDKLDDMTNKFQGLENVIRELAQNKENKPLPVELIQPENTYASKVKSSRSVIVIKKKGNGPPANMDVIYQAAVDNNAAVSNAYKNNTGDTVVVCEDEQSMQSLVPVLTDKMDTEKFEVVTPPRRLPTISIIDIGSKYTKSELLERVKSQNAYKFSGIDLNEDNFKVIFFRAQVKNNDLYKATVRVSEEVRKLISNANNKLNIGLRSCPVFDEFFVKKCNK